MTPEERDLISRFIARVAGAPQSGGFVQGPPGGPQSGSVPASQPQLPPIDQEADVFLAQQFQQYPEARYRVTQTAIIQEAALAEAQNRIRRLEADLQQARQAAAPPAQQGAFAQQAAQPQRGFLSGLFGGAQPAAPQQQTYGQAFQQPSPPPYQPSYQPGMMQQGGGSSFLGSALTTAAGVAGGMVVGNALMGAFSGHHGGAEAAASPWGAAASNTSGSVFDGAGIVPTDPTTGYPDTSGYASNTGYVDPFAGGGDPKDNPPDPAWDQSAADPFAGTDSSGGGFDDGNA